MLEQLSRLVCDECKQRTSPLVKTDPSAVARNAGWKTYKRHVCPACFRQMVGGCDKVQRAKMALSGTSGESCRDFAKECRVTTQTIINWARSISRPLRTRGER